MPPLTVPVPTLIITPNPPGLATLENMIQVLCAVPIFPDGTLFRPEDQGTAGFLIYRMAASGALWEVWNDAAKQWQPASGDVTALPKQPLVFTPGDPAPWQGILVAAGQQDRGGNPQFDAAATASPFPQYAVRAYFSTVRAG
jgi:hypothetical protein